MALAQVEAKKTFWSGLLNTLLVWTKVSRWRKASKCKRTIKKLQLHLTIQNNRRDAVIRQSRIDIAQLLQTGHINQALDRVEQLYKDQCRLSAYDQINHFCLYLVNLSHFYNQSSTLSLPISVGEAVSTLIFAASRCGELPELHTLRLLFKERYGYKFEKVNVELLPGNLVNSQIKKDLCMNSVPDYVKNNLISEISREFTFNLEFQSHRQISVKPEVGMVHDHLYGTSGSNMEEKSLKQESDNENSVSNSSRNASIGSMGNVNPATTKPVMPRSQYRYRWSSTQEPLSNTYLNSLHNDRLSLDGSIDRMKEQEGYSCSSHVHPKLPEYEDIVSKLKDIKAKCRH